MRKQISFGLIIITILLTLALVVGCQQQAAPIEADGNYNENEWEDVTTIEINGGLLQYKNDKHFLYILLDVVEDTGNDPPTSEGDFPQMDGFRLDFDIDNDKKGSERIDVGYCLYRCNVPDNPGNNYKLAIKYVIRVPKTTL